MKKFEFDFFRDITEKRLNDEETAEIREFVSRFFLNNVDYKTLNEVVKKILNLYKWALFYVDAYPGTKEADYYQEVIKTFEANLSFLGASESEFIRKEIEEFNELDWWKSFYSRSTYYRIKRKAFTELILILKETRNDAILLVLQLFIFYCKKGE